MSATLQDFTIAFPASAYVPGGTQPSLVTKELDKQGVLSAVESYRFEPRHYDEVKNFLDSAVPGSKVILTHGHLTMVVFRHV